MIPRSIVCALLVCVLVAVAVHGDSGRFPGDRSPSSPGAQTAAYQDLGVTPGHLSNLWWIWNTNSAVQEDSSPPLLIPSSFVASGIVDCSQYMQLINGKKVLFLTGQLITGNTLPPVTRTCQYNIPANTYIYFPVLNGETDREDPIPADHPLSFPGCLSPRGNTNKKGVTNPMIRATVDGASIGNVADNWVIADPEKFTVQSLPNEVAKGYNEIGSSFAVGLPRWVQSGGYYVLLKPLAPGAHTIVIDLDVYDACGLPRGIVAFQVTYKFTVSP